MNLLVRSWQSLTHRGRFFLLGGLAGTIVALSWGQRDLAWLGLLLVVLPLAALLVLRRTRLSLTSERSIRPVRVPLGDRLTAHLRLDKSGALPVGLLQFEDAVPVQLGRRPRFAAHRVTGAWEREITYPLLGLARGRYAVGPLTVRAGDPFGMATLLSTFTNTNEVLVTPHVYPLSAMTDAGGVGTSGDTTPQRIGRIGQDDVLVREYRQGDDVRRVHWRSTARWDELMVRREEQAWEPSATVLLDNRASRHAGTGRTSSFEWAVSMTASICDHFARSGYRVSLVDADGTVVAGGVQDPGATQEACLLALTDVAPDPVESLSTAASATLASREGEIIVAVLGQLTREDAATLGRIRRARSQGFAIVLDPPTFNGTDRGLGLDAEQLDALNQLRDQRWRVVLATNETPVPTAWSLLGRELTA